MKRSVSVTWQRALDGNFMSQKSINEWENLVFWSHRLTIDVQHIYAYWEDSWCSLVLQIYLQSRESSSKSSSKYRTLNYLKFEQFTESSRKLCSEYFALRLQLHSTEFLMQLKSPGNWKVWGKIMVLSSTLVEDDDKGFYLSLCFRVNVAKHFYPCGS